jgi:hypothetical protein
MSKVNYKSTYQIDDIFDTLENYLKFCRQFGHVYNEADVYNNKSYPWQQYQKFLAGNYVKNAWTDLINNHTPRKYNKDNQKSFHKN